MTRGEGMDGVRIGAWLASALHPYDEPFLLDLDACTSCATSPQDEASCDGGGVDDNGDDDPMLCEINRVAMALQRIAWLPASFVALSIQHQVDVACLMELTDVNLRRSFFIDDSETRGRLLSYIRLCQTVRDTARREVEERCQASVP